MLLIARILGMLLIVYGLLGVFFALLGAGQGFAYPIWNEQAWTADARRAADWATSLVVALGGLLMLLGLGASRLVLLLAIAIAAARIGYDLALGDPTTARQSTLLIGDAVALGAALLGLVVGLVAFKRRTVTADHSLGSAGAT